MELGKLTLAATAPIRSDAAVALSRTMLVTASVRATQSAVSVTISTVTAPDVCPTNRESMLRIVALQPDFQSSLADKHVGNAATTEKAEPFLVIARGLNSPG